MGAVTASHSSGLFVHDFKFRRGTLGQFIEHRGLVFRDCSAWELKLDLWVGVR
jgi:hypothetical protein